MLTKRPKMCWKLLNRMAKNVPGTAMLEDASTMTKCTEPTIPDQKYQLLFVVNFVN